MDQEAIELMSILTHRILQILYTFLSLRGTRSETPEKGIKEQSEQGDACSPCSVSISLCIYYFFSCLLIDFMAHEPNKEISQPVETAFMTRCKLSMESYADSENYLD